MEVKSKYAELIRKIEERVIGMIKKFLKEEARKIPPKVLLVFSKNEIYPFIVDEIESKLLRGVKIEGLSAQDIAKFSLAFAIKSIKGILESKMVLPFGYCFFAMREFSQKEFEEKFDCPQKRRRKGKAKVLLIDFGFDDGTNLVEFFCVTGDEVIRIEPKEKITNTFVFREFFGSPTTP